MTQWEYGRLARFFNGDELRITWIGPDGHEKALPGVHDVVVPLNEFGAEGWELVAVTEREHHDTEADTWWNHQWYHLKRESTDVPVRRAW
jgi:hypothetical protein